MAVPRLRTIVFALATGLTFGLAAVPARAQDPGPGGAQPASRELAELRARFAALSRRVAKLEGRLVAADLVGTYTLSVIQTELHGDPARARTTTTAGTVTLAADGTGSASQSELGVRLTQGVPWLVTPIDESGDATFSWTYADGTVQFSAGGGDSGSMSVAAGGRLLIYVSRDNVHAELGILTRLH
jgi:hypothetical protein